MIARTLKAKALKVGDPVPLLTRAYAGPHDCLRRIRAQGLSTGGDGGCDYPAAQAYAAGLVTLAAIRAPDSLDQERIRAAISDLRTTTFFGDFAIDAVTGRQTGHKRVLIQWHGGRKVIIDSVALSDSGDLELPVGWRLILAPFRSLRLTRRKEEAAEARVLDDGTMQDPHVAPEKFGTSESEMLLG